MLFQTLDDKKECVGIYHAGALSFNDAIPTSLTHTWSYSSFLADHDIEYAKIYCGGLSLREACPDHLTERWERVEEKLKALLKSFHTSRVSLNENCFFDLVPKRFLLEMCYVKDMICEHIFANYEKPKNYDYVLSLTKNIEDIKHRKLNINAKNLLLYKSKHRKFAKKLKEIMPYCKFNIDGTKTGRLTTNPTGFPILTLNKELRPVIEPSNDYFVELDFNAAELRTLIALQGKPQPDEDIHEWNIQNVFRGLGTRDEAKKRIFAWLYNPESDDYLCSRAYDRNSVVQKYFTKGQVTTFWNKVIPSEERTALNYIIQSTCAENVLRQMVKVSKYLEELSSCLAFPIHDSIVLDMSKRDAEKLPEIINIFSNTELGTFKVNVSCGPNFGNLKKMEI
ncbi:MAG: hypothetical protein H8E74_05940 [Gammaproteobacteria bacterium]|nr:hypothetical protein [Gammaproteobacteria bacterium]